MLNSTALSFAPVAAPHLPLAHCSPSRSLSAVHCSPRAAPPPDSPLPLLPLLPDPPRPVRVSHWPQRLAPLGSAGDAFSRLLRFMLLLIFFLVTTVPVHFCCSPTSTVCCNSTSSSLFIASLMSLSSWWEAGTFFPSPPSPSFRLPSCSSAPPCPFTLAVSRPTHHVRPLPWTRLALPLPSSGPFLLSSSSAGRSGSAFF